MSSAEGIAVPSVSRLVELRFQARQLHFFPKRQTASAGGGGYRSRYRSRGMDFEEVRPYQPGDDIRTIDWRVTARTTQTHTKVFREERERPVLIALDLRTSMFFGSYRLKSMVACEVAATLAWAGLAANDRVGGLIFTPSRQRDIRAKRSKHNVLRFINDMHESCEELLDSGDDNISLQGIFESLRRIAAPGTTLVVISDFHDLEPGCEKHLYALAQHCDIVLASISDPLEAELPPPGRYAVSDGRDQYILDSRDIGTREDFRKRFVRHQAQLEQMAARLGCSLVKLTTDKPILPALSAVYGRARNRVRR